MDLAWEYKYVNLFLSYNGNFNALTGFDYYHNNAYFKNGIYVDYFIVFSNASTGDAAYTIRFKHELPVDGNLYS